MTPPPVLDDESARQAVVDSLDLLDTGTDVRFSELVELAAFISHTPMAALSLIDNERQWFKSTLGIDLEGLVGAGVFEVPRAISFCGHTIGGESLVVPDTLLDERFADSPFVVSPPHVRFYAGVSVLVDGHNVGTLCVMDTRPRTFLTDERRALEILGRQAAAQIQLHRIASA